MISLIEGVWSLEVGWTHVTTTCLGAPSLAPSSHNLWNGWKWGEVNSPTTRLNFPQTLPTKRRAWFGLVDRTHSLLPLLLFWIRNMSGRPTKGSATGGASTTPPVALVAAAAIATTAPPAVISGASEGDWICPDAECANMNFARRTACNRCGTEKPVDDSKKKCVGIEIGKAAAEKSRGLFSADDWQCTKCGNVNWARRSSCNVCNAPKFKEVEERTGYGGGYNDRGIVEYKEREESDDEYDEFGRKKKKFRKINAGESQSDYDKAEKEYERGGEKSNGQDKEDDDEEEEEDDDDDEDGDLSKYDLSDWGTTEEKTESTATDSTDINNQKEIIKTDNIEKDEEKATSSSSSKSDSSSSRSPTRNTKKRKTSSKSSNSKSRSRSRSNSRSRNRRSRSKSRERRRSRSKERSSRRSRSRSRDKDREKRNNRSRDHKKSRSRSRSRDRRDRRRSRDRDRRRR